MIDSDGNIWMKINNDFEESSLKITLYEIVKINSSKTTMEIAQSAKEGWYGKNYPEIIAHNISYTYYILYPQ